MNARAPQTKKLSCQGKPVKESLDRKSPTGVGWNKYLDLHTTQTPLLRFVFSLLARRKRGPNWFEHPRGETQDRPRF